MIDRLHLDQLKTKPRTSASFVPGTWDDETNSIEVTWYTGAEVARYNWEDGEFFLSFDFAGVDLTRYNAGAAVLKDHRDHTSDAQIGKVMEGTARVENGMGKARVQFSRDPALAAFVQDVKDGIRKNLSMGADIDRSTLAYISKKGVAGQTVTRLRAMKWTPYELSFVTVGADPGAQTLSADFGAGDPSMTTTYAPTEAEKAQLRAQVLNEQKERLRAIKAAARIAAPIGAEKLEAMIEKFAESDLPIDEIGPKFVDARLAWDAEQIVHGQQGTTVNSEGRHKLGKLLVKALAVEMGAETVTLKDDERRFLHENVPNLTQRRLAEGVLQRKGVKFSHLDDGEIMEYARLHSTTAESVMRYRLSRPKYERNFVERLGEVTIDDLDIVFGSATELVIMDGVKAQPTTYQYWSIPIPMGDFRETKYVDLSEFPDLEEVPESGVPTEGTIAEKGEPISLTEWGRRIKFSRRAGVNDRYGIIGRTFRNYGRRISAFRDAKMYALLQLNSGSGPQLTQNESGTYLFSSTNGNVGTTGALSADLLAELRKKVREQSSVTDAEGGSLKLDAEIALWLTGTTLEHKMEQLLATNGYMPTTSSGVVTESIRKRHVASPHITSATSFYGFADPGMHPCFGEAVLGNEGVLVDQLFDERSRGVETIVRVAAKANALSFRGCARNAGA